jgi:O-antigen/teichoic acid export membrane protein
MANTFRQVFKNTTVLAIEDVSDLLASFVLVFLLARSLGTAGLGSYTTVLAYYGLAIDLCGVGVRNLLIREIARDLSKTNRYIIHAGVITAAVSMVGTIVLALLVPWLGHSPETTAGVVVMSLSLIPATWLAIYETVFIAHQKAEYLLYSTLLTRVGRIGISTYLLFSGYSVISLFVTYLVFVYISFLLQTFYLVRHIVVPRWEFDAAFAWRLLKDLRTFTALGFLASIFSQVEILLLSILGGEVAVGIYSAASKLIIMWLVIPWSYMRAVFPLLAQRQVSSPEDFQRLIEKSVKYLLALALPLAIGIVVTADPIIRLFYGPGFEASIPVLRGLALLLIPIFLNEVLWRILIARNEQHLALRAQVAGITVKAGASLLAVPVISYMGTLLAMALTQVVHTTMHMFFVQRGGAPIPLFRLVWRFGLAAVLMGGVSWLLGIRFGLFVVVPFAVLFYGLLIFLLRAFSADDLALFIRLIAARKVSSGVSELALGDGEHE